MFGFDTIHATPTHSRAKHISLSLNRTLYNSYLRIIIKHLPEDTIEQISKWLESRNWNVHPVNCREDLLAQHYDPTSALLAETRDQLKYMNIVDFEMDDP